ncbi:MAG TPA: FkbM family methyltransferase, partial [Phnomibacter sp.]|nr:FkbM family methyltransferase [Phnomibacter sp.]
MVRAIKSWLLKILGPHNYLSLTSNLFFLYFKNGWLRNDPAYYAHYMVGKVIRPGQTIIDIGANLGYYTRLFAKRTGTGGKVWAVEPIELYRSILEQNTAGYPQVTILPYALGKENGSIRMGNPTNNKHRHG